MNRSKNYYNYVFSNKACHTMTPREAHNYAYKHMVDILRGPGYQEGKREPFTGWGWHQALQMTFKGPNHYRTYLKANNLHEAGINDCPKEGEFKKPLWDEELLRKAIQEHGLDIGSVMAEALLSGEMDFPEEGNDGAEF